MTGNSRHALGIASPSMGGQDEVYLRRADSRPRVACSVGSTAEKGQAGSWFPGLTWVWAGFCPLTTGLPCSDRRDQATENP